MKKVYEVTETFDNGKKLRQEWKVEGKRHREDDPAYIGYYEDGSISYECYYIEGKYHREDGPASIGYNKDGSIRYEWYYIEGKLLSKEDFLKRTQQSCSGKIVTIDGKKYKLEEV